MRVQQCHKCKQTEREFAMKQNGEGKWECIGKCRMPDLVIPAEYASVIQGMCELQLADWRGELDEAAEELAYLRNAGHSSDRISQAERRFNDLVLEVDQRREAVRKVFGERETSS